MKKTFALVVVGCLLINPLHANIKVIATLSDLAEFTKIVGGDRVDVESIVRGTQNPHFIEVKPSYMMKLKSADLFVMAGMQLEMWAPQIIDGSRNSRLRIVDCSKYVDKLEVPAGKADASLGDVHPFGNPHYWLDPENVKPILLAIMEGLASVSPNDRALFQANMDAYLKTLQTKISEWKKEMEPYKGAQFISYHTSFSYFAHRFGLIVAGYVEPRPGIPPTPSHISELIDLMRHANIKVIGLEQFYEDSAPQSVANAVGAKVVKLSTSVGGVRGTDTYTALIDYNVRMLSEALK
jgi:zinc/manganese transport system substrate-binding protein